MSTILVVEDEPILHRAMVRGLGRRHEVHAALDRADAERVYREQQGRIEVVVSDVNLPDGDGIDFVQWCRRLDPTVGAVVATGIDDRHVADRVVASQVQGYLLKPFEHNELEVNVANAARWRELEREGRAQRDRLGRLVEIRTAEVRSSQWETLHRLAIAAEFRDPETSDHLERMSAYSALLAEKAGLSCEESQRIRLASPMHDIGKIGIPDDVLTHDGPFDDHQRAVMSRHTDFGWEILQGSNSPLLDVAATIARTHHEWWDGSGYPRGLAGEDIPLEGRIVAIADVFDALTTRRRYKRAFELDEAFAVMQGERGTHFDPDLLDLFLGDPDELATICEGLRGATVASG